MNRREFFAAVLAIPCAAVATVNEDSIFERRKFQVQEVCRAFNVPPRLIDWSQCNEKDILGEVEETL